MRVDTNTKGHRQWFYFSIKNTNKQRIKINIFRFKKKYSLYQRGMKPYVRSRKSGYDWAPGGQNVQYCIQKINKLQQLNRNFVAEDHKQSYYLSFTYKFQYQNDQVFFAACIPYTYTFLENRLSQFSNIVNLNQKSQIKFQVKKLTKSACGLSLPLIIIQKKIQSKNTENQNKEKQSHEKLAETNTTKGDYLTPRSQLSKNQQINFGKRIIIINTRSHSGQSSGSWVLDGFLQQLIKSKQVAEWIVKNNVCFKIVPMLNVDGVFMGNYRTGIVGDDFNRKFLSGKKQYFPEIFGLKKLIFQSKRQGYVELFLDLHGHSVLKNSFIFGPIEQMFKNEALKFLPHKLWHSTKYFKMNNCKFRMQKDLIQTARIFFQVKQQILCFTCENSLGLYYSQGQTFHYLKEDYKQFGISILESFKQLITQSNRNTVKNADNLLSQYQVNLFSEKAKKNKSLNSSLINFDQKSNKLKQSQPLHKQAKVMPKVKKNSEERVRKAKQSQEKRNTTEGQEFQIKQIKRKQASTQKKKFTFEKLPNLSKQHFERQKPINQNKKSRNNFQRQKSILQALQAKKQELMMNKNNVKGQSQKIKLFGMEQLPIRQFSNAKISIKTMNYKKRRDMYNFLPQTVKNKINLKPLNNDFQISTKFFEEINLQDYERSITFDQSYLQKKIKQQQIKAFQEDSQNQEQQEIYQNFSQNYESINDLDSQSQDLDINQKRYILDHIKASGLNRKKSQQCESQQYIEQKQENEEQQEQINREYTHSITNINRFKQIKFKSVQSHQNSAINRSTFSINKQNNLKRQKQTKFKEIASKMIRKSSILQQDDQQKFVSIIHKKRLSQRPAIKGSIRQPYLLLKLKPTLSNKNKINFDYNYQD